jgi:hypothetical protein
MSHCVEIDLAGRAVETERTVDGSRRNLIRRLLELAVRTGRHFNQSQQPVPAVLGYVGSGIRWRQAATLRMLQAIAGDAVSVVVLPRGPCVIRHEVAAG